jgi:hypothetical protein
VPTPSPHRLEALKGATGARIATAVLHRPSCCLTARHVIANDLGDCLAVTDSLADRDIVYLACGPLNTASLSHNVTGSPVSAVIRGGDGGTQWTGIGIMSAHVPRGRWGRV